MPSTTELYLILRARDEASRVVRAFGAELALLDKVAHRAAMNQFMAGAAVASIGVGITSVGVLAVNALNNMTTAAVDYNEETAKTLTQVDQAGISFDHLSEMGKRVARNVPVAFEQIQPALYDIFSSINVNAPQAEKLLEDIGKAAVGGTTNMETAGRALISILNAYKMPVEQAGQVSDIMFKLVQKGVGTYEEFTSVIGRAVPSAIKAGQSFADLAGMMAFLTRNGQSTANAATSAARALDMFSKPSAIRELKEMGIAVEDSSGKFRPILDIVTELREKLEKFGSVGAAKKLNEIFKGSGANIQAMRFMNLAVDDNLGLLGELTEEIRQAGGEAQKAYATMANTPAGKLQALNNEYQIMSVTIGQQLLPIKLALAQALNALLEWWNNLSPSVRTAIVAFVGISAVLSILIGIVLVFTGAIIMMAAAWTLAQASLAPFIAVVLPIIGIAAAVVLGIIAIAVVFKLIYDRSAVVRQAVSDLVDTLKELWNTIVNSVKGALKGFVDMLGGPTRLMNAFKFILMIVGAYLQAVFKVVLTAVTYIIKGLGVAISMAWKGL